MDLYGSSLTGAELRRRIGHLSQVGGVRLLTSDNGPECEVPPHGHTPFRGCKGSSWEGGVRVPTFVYWKGMIAPRKSEGLFDQADIFNTLISMAGAPGAKLAEYLPDDRYVDGVDQASFPRRRQRPVGATCAHLHHESISIGRARR